MQQAGSSQDEWVKVMAAAVNAYSGQLDLRPVLEQSAVVGAVCCIPTPPAPCWGVWCGDVW